MPVRDVMSRLDAEPVVGSRGVAWAESVLREQHMPAAELQVVLTSADRELVRRHLDLHLERLDERLVSQKRRVQEVGRILRKDHRDLVYRVRASAGTGAG